MPDKRNQERRTIERRHTRRRLHEIPETMVAKERRLLKDRRMRLRREGVRRDTDNFSVKKRLFAKVRPAPKKKRSAI